MATRIIQAERDQMMHAQLAHVAERHFGGSRSAWPRAPSNVCHQKAKFCR